MGSLPNSDAEEVVRELDVVVFAGALGAGTKARMACQIGTGTVLLQYPLRGASRPYQFQGVGTMQYKPNAKKLQVDVPLDTRCSEYNTHADPAHAMSSLTLQGSGTDCGGCIAAAYVEGERLILLPIDEVMQLRPALQHLETEEGGKRAGANADTAGDAKAEDELTPLVVQVRKRETEAQQEARLRSYAHIAAQEAAEPWHDVKYHGETSEVANGLAMQLASRAVDPVMHSMPRDDYLAALVPPRDPESVAGPAEVLVGAAATASGGPVAGGAAPVARRGTQALPDSLLPSLSRELRLLLTQHQVCALGTVRGFLQARNADPALTAAVSDAGDESLRASLTACPELRCVRGGWALKTLGNPGTDGLRTVVLDMLEQREALKKSDVAGAARAAGVPWSDAGFSRVVREICTSRGSLWFLNQA